VDVLALKLVVTPLLILAASLAGRRWGETVSGWFVGLPLTSGPICFFLAVEQGPDFAATAARGCLAGAAAEAGFVLAYAAVASYAAWPVSLAAATIAFASFASLLALSAPPLVTLALLGAVVLTTTLAVLPTNAMSALILPAPPRWDIPARIVVAPGLSWR